MMPYRIKALVLYWAIIVTVIVAPLIPTQEASAEQTGSFTGLPTTSA